MDKRGEKQSSDYVKSLLTLIDTNRTNAEFLTQNKIFHVLSSQSIKKLQHFGKLENINILKADAHLSYSQDLGIHSVAEVIAETSYENGEAKIKFFAHKHHGLWELNDISVLTFRANI